MSQIIVITNQKLQSNDTIAVLSFEDLAYTDEYGDKSYLTLNGAQYQSDGSLATWMRINLTSLGLASTRLDGRDMHGSTGRFMLKDGYGAAINVAKYAQDCVGQNFRKGSGLQLTPGGGVGLGSIRPKTEDAYIAFEVKHNGLEDQYEGYDLTPIGICGEFEVVYPGGGKSTVASNSFDISSLIPGNPAPAPTRQPEESANTSAEEVAAVFS